MPEISRVENNQIAKATDIASDEDEHAKPYVQLKWSDQQATIDWRTTGRVRAHRDWKQERAEE